MTKQFVIQVLGSNTYVHGIKGNAVDTMSSVPFDAIWFDSKEEAEKLIKSLFNPRGSAFQVIEVWL